MPCLSLKHVLASRAIVKQGKKAQKAERLATKTAKIQAAKATKPQVPLNPSPPQSSLRPRRLRLLKPPKLLPSVPPSRISFRT